MTIRELERNFELEMKKLQEQVDNESSVTIDIRVPEGTSYNKLNETQKSTFDSVVNQTDKWFKNHIEYYVGKRDFLVDEILIIGSQDNLEDEDFQDMLGDFNYYDNPTFVDEKNVELICLIGRASDMSWIKGNFSDKEFLENIKISLLTNTKAWTTGLVPDWAEHEMEF